jgi:cytochrome P450
MAQPPRLSQLQNLRFAQRLLADPRAPIAEYTERLGPVWQSMMPGTREGKTRLLPLTWLMGRDGNERVLAPKYKDDFTWYEGYRFTMEPLFGRRILLLLDDDPDANPGAHRERVRILHPAFHARLDDTYLPQMSALVERLLIPLPTDRPIELQALVQRITFHLIASLLMGASPADCEAWFHPFEELGRGLFSVVHIDLPGFPFHRARRARATLDRYLLAALADMRCGRRPPSPMIENLLAAQAAAPTTLLDQDIVAELISFLYAGFDTTASVLTSTLVLLAHHPAILATLVEALDRPDAEPLPFLDAVLLEAERLWPPLLFLMRGVRRDLTFAGFDLPAGTKVAYSPYLTHRQASLFPDPLRFQPARFLDADGHIVRPPPYTLVGFGGGHRMCIGRRLATLELRMVLSRLLRHYHLDFPADLLPRANSLFFNPAPQRKLGLFARLTPKTRPSAPQKTTCADA